MKASIKIKIADTVVRAMKSDSWIIKGQKSAFTVSLHRRLSVASFVFWILAHARHCRPPSASTLN